MRYPFAVPGRNHTLVLLFCALAAPVVTAASTVGAQADSEAAVEVDLSAPLTLADTVRLGATRNLDLISERLALKREVSRQRGAWQTYSPTLTLRTGLFQSRPLGTVHAPAGFSYAAGISWLSPLGTRVSADVSLAHPIRRPEEPAEGEVVVGVAQPLLKDAWLTGAALPLQEAELQTAVQRELFRDALNATVLQLEAAYWDLAVAEADVEIKTRSRQRAQQQFEDTQENIRRGILADVELYVVQENVVFFEQELVQAGQNLQLARRRLAQLLAVDANLPLRTAEALKRPAIEVPPTESVLSAGLASNPQLRAQRWRGELAALRERYSVNQALPSLDLAASVSLQGADTDYAGTWGATLTDTGPQAQVGVVFALPLDRGAVDAAVKTASHEHQRQQQLLSAEQQRVQHALLNGLTDLQTQLELLTLTERQVTLAELKLQAENEKYKNGISTLTDVVRFQRDLDNAAIRLRRVIRSVQVGRASLLASQGTLHDAFGIEVR